VPFSALPYYFFLQVLFAQQSAGLSVDYDSSSQTFAYQGAGRGFDLGVLQTLEQWVQCRSDKSPALLQPQLTIWFELPPQVAAARLAGARLPDKFESQPLAFFEAVAGGYATRLAQDPGRFARINADQSPEAVRAQVLAALRAKALLSGALDA
jgi:dTMP kinase